MDVLEQIGLMVLEGQFGSGWLKGSPGLQMLAQYEGGLGPAVDEQWR